MSKLESLCVLVVLLLLATAGAPVSAQTPAWPADVATRPAWVADELLVKFATGAPPAARERAQQAVAASELRALGNLGVRQWRLGPGMSVERALAILARPEYASILEYAEPNAYFYSAAWPSDPLRAELWGQHNFGGAGGVRDADIDALDAWTVTTGSRSVVVAVIDTGIDYTHPDLAANLWTNPGEIDGNGLDDDGNGYVDDVHGWNFIAGTSDPRDDAGHGTHVSGTVGAVGDNGTGVAGVAWQVQIMPLKFLDGSGQGSTANAILAIQYATRFGVKIHNNSWSGTMRSRSLEDAIAASGALSVCAAGNDGNSKAQYPAASDLPNIVSVAATDRSDLLASFSSRSASWVDLGAPGVGIYSTERNAAYGSRDGTSMAAPHVAGAAALLAAVFPAWGPADLKGALLGSVDPLPSLAGKTVTGGRLNAARALGVTPAPDVDPAPPGAVSDLALADPAGYATLTLGWTATADDAGGTGAAWCYELRYATAPLDESNWNSATSVAGEPVPGLPGAVEHFSLTGLTPEKTYWIALKVVDEYGNLSPLSNVLEARTIAPATPWVVEPVPNSASAGSWSLAYDAAGRPAIGAAVAGTIRYYHRTDAGWESDLIETADGSSMRLAFDPIDHYPSLLYVWDGKLKFADWNGSAWTIETVETRYAGASLIGFAYDPSGRPAAAYQYSGRSGGLRFARKTAGTWTMETVDPGGTRYCSLAFGPDGTPAIAYSQAINSGFYNTLRLARKPGSTWQLETVETGVTGYGVWVDIAFDLSGNPVMVHRASGTRQIRVVFRDGSRWSGEAAYSGTTYTPDYPSLAIDGMGVAHVAFYEPGYIRAAHRWTPGSWEAEIIETATQSPSFPVDIAIDADGRPAAGYADHAESTLKYGVR
jgi:subtilisin family serine protease